MSSTHGISHVRASLEHLIDGIKHDDLERSADIFDELAVEYEASPDKAAANPPICQISEWVAALWHDVDVSATNFAAVLEAAAADCRSAAQGDDR